MARKTVFIDDFEDSGTVEADAGTIPFAFEGQSYEIDLSSKNATKLRNQLAPWITKARKVGAVRHAAKGKPTPTGSGMSREQLEAVRDWARRQGMQVNPKGRIPKDILLAFEQAQAPQEPKGKGNHQPEFSG